MTILQAFKVAPFCPQKWSCDVTSFECQKFVYALKSHWKQSVFRARREVKCACNKLFEFFFQKRCLYKKRKKFRINDFPIAAILKNTAPSGT